MLRLLVYGSTLCCDICKEISMEQNKESEIDAHTHAQMTFDKDAKAIELKRDILFIKWCLSYIGG